jgi:dTMP kinase
MAGDPPGLRCSAGRLICLDGIDGAGKTTHARRLAARLRAAGVRARTIVTVSRTDDFMPTLRAVQGHTTRQTMADLIVFERLRRVRRLIVPALARREVIVCDRYFYTDIVYAAANGCDCTFASALFALAPRPDVMIVLRTPHEVAIERVAARSHPPGWAPNHQAQFLRDAARRFAQLASDGVTLIDTDRPFPVVADEVFATVSAAISLEYATASGTDDRRR